MRLWIGVVTVSIVLSLSGWVRAQCGTDNDCKGDRICEAGECKQPPAMPPPPAPPPASDAPADSTRHEGPIATPIAGPAQTPAAPAVKASVTDVEPTPEQSWHRRSGGAIAGGIVMVSMGALASLGGLAVLNESAGHCDNFGDCISKDEAIGYVLLGGGLGLAGGGLALIVWGAKKVPSYPAAQARLGAWLCPGSAGMSLGLEM